MRILHFYKTTIATSMGGVEKFIDELADATARAGIHTDVLALAEEDGVSPANGRTYHQHTARLDFQIASTGFSYSVFSAFSRLADKADIIHYHFPWPLMDVVHFATRTKKRTVLTYHSDIVRQKRLLHLYRPIKHRFLADMNHIVATSPNYVRSSPVLERYLEKVSVIPIGISASSLLAVTQQKLDDWRTRVGERFFLFIGVLRYYKGLDVLLEAARNLPIPLVIVGSGPLEQKLRAEVQRQGLSNVQLLGFVPDEDKFALLQLCSGMVFPSHLRSEAFGISLLEAAMSGKPLISCEISTGTSYINVHGQTGLVIPPGDAPALRAAMQQLWDHPAEALLMGARARQRFEELFTVEKMTSSYMKVYSDLMSSPVAP